VRPTSLIKRFGDPEEGRSLVAYIASPLDLSHHRGCAAGVDGGVIRSASDIANGSSSQRADPNPRTSLGVSKREGGVATTGWREPRYLNTGGECESFPDVHSPPPPHTQCGGRVST